MKKLLIAGYGDIARRAMPRLQARYVVQALSRRHGFDLDRPETLAGLAAGDAVLHCAPPPPKGVADTRTAYLLAALAKGRILPARVVYVSTSGVYGDCGGARVDETRAVQPQTDRARRRVDAERQLAQWCSERAVALVILRAPGIYAADRLPLERLRRGTPVLRSEEDVYTNHIHAEDLAAIAVRALEDDAPGGTYNASDDSEIRMGDWLDLVAERTGLARPPRVARSEAAGRIAPELLSFMNESRRLANRRMKEELGVRLCYRTVFEGVPRTIGVA
ncbi:MAG: SDR family NAD(P)-dependent oxidoreductase [Betaproteobacteria bacterium]|nr:SDR family NAD(P)-dependent oxidoreductase [Betaproteobacteria bacterium]MDH5576940.1 SDR family NAD(P)-dependent oxidoreductase [Betaproteobacteria bacterium]